MRSSVVVLTALAALAAAIASGCGTMSAGALTGAERYAMLEAGDEAEAFRGALAAKKLKAPRPRRMRPPAYRSGGEIHVGGGIEAAAPVGVTIPLLAAPGVDPGRAERLVVYNGSVHLVVRDVSHALEGVNAIAVKFGGYMQAMDAKSITVKVPANRFREVMAEVEELGEVTQKSIKGTDVTEEMRDLRLRLKNAEEVRARLVKLLEKCEKVEDAIKIEKELGRLTGEIELFKGKIRHLEHSVAYSELTVHVNSPVPQTKKHQLPFEWVSALGDELLRGGVSRRSRHWQRKRWVKFELPGGYINYFEWPHLARAMSADNVFIRIERHGNGKGGDIEFWQKIVRREVTARKAFAVSEEKEPVLDTLADARMLVAAKETGGKLYGYLLAVVVNKKHVYTFEAWGPFDEFEKDRKELVRAVESMRIKP